jgi:hypothetical protein
MKVSIKISAVLEFTYWINQADLRRVADSLFRPNLTSEQWENAMREFKKEACSSYLFIFYLEVNVHFRFVIIMDGSQRATTVSVTRSSTLSGSRHDQTPSKISSKDASLRCFIFFPPSLSSDSIIGIFLRVWPVGRTRSSGRF